jgi:hypothetical protein
VGVLDTSASTHLLIHWPSSWANETGRRVGPEAPKI